MSELVKFPSEIFLTYNFQILQFGVPQGDLRAKYKAPVKAYQIKC